MSAPVVYDNVDNVNGKYLGTLFGGVKFFVHQRVPSRSTLLESIKTNGGKIVQLEKHADVKIADHARKDVPAGFHSWKFIDDSMKAGELLDLGKYKIGNEPRSVGSAQPTKGTKNRFTEEEDRQLADYMLQRVSVQDEYQGQKHFQDFIKESGSSRHTWQSYRDRWVKKVNPELLLEARQQNPAVRAASPPLISDRTTPSVRRTSAAVVSAASEEDSDPVPDLVPREPGRRVKFSEKDDDILRKWVRTMAPDGKGERGNIIYEELEAKYPHHTYQSWRDRWVRRLSREVPEREASGHRRLSTPAGETSSSRSADRDSKQPVPAGRRLPQPAPTKQKSAARSRTQQLAQDAAVVRNGAHQPQPRANNAVRNLELTENLRRGRSAKLIQRVWRGYRDRKKAAELRRERAKLEGERAELEREKAELLTEVKSEPDWIQSEVGAIAPEFVATSEPSTPEQRFWKDYRIYCEMASVQQVPWVKIRGKSVPLWELWHAATKQKLPAEHREWEDIADDLKLDWIADPKIPVQLQVAFEEHLAVFEDSLKDLDGSGDEDLDDEDEYAEDEDVDGVAVPEAEPRSPGLFVSSRSQSALFESSPPITGLKRRFGDAMLSPTVGRSSPSKRRRYEEDEEIPCTPDKPRQTPNLGLRNRLLSTPIRTKPLDSSPQRLPSRVAVEPETQDFQFGLDAEELQDSPSQQLRHEGAQLALRRSKQQVANSGGRPTRSAHTSSPASSSSGEFPSLDKLRSRPKNPPPPLDVDPDSDEYFDPPVRSGSLGGGTRPTRPVQTPVPQALPSTWKKTAQQAVAVQQPSRQSLTPTANPPTHRSPRWSSSATPRQVSQGTRPQISLKKENSVIEHFERLGYQRETILVSLQATTGKRGLAGHVMQSIADGHGIPTNERGVWTDVDDKKLKKIGEVDFAAEASATGREKDKIIWARGSKRKLERKHGQEAYEKRRVYLKGLEKKKAAEVRETTKKMAAGWRVMCTQGSP
ncbi:TRF2-interacting telomeric protein/Rap1 C terminal domain-containing protein [Cercophora newfieldiana]|uniref:DNA-binding protein RAP1 n=1 Tax=Cercophora newfieldiana TaxID=92897 RepID=A0AA40CK14_9PEZI|nr:TRF2-interacting telomeric protein/Rap1 C terminal domain-containing protein [Cercophora newfieldiana]